MPRSGSRFAADVLAVLVEAAAALASEPAFGDQLFLDRARPPALRLAALGVEGAGDAEVDVEADQVDQLERAHAEAAAEPADAVDRRRVGDPLGQHPQRLQREGAGEAVGDEAGAVLGADRRAAHPPRRPRRSPSSASAEESAVATTSTSFISAGGLKKCMPTTRSGWGTPAAIAVTGSEEVLVARIASGPQASARAANSSRFSSRSSGAASTTRSQSAEVGEARRRRRRGRWRRRRPPRSSSPVAAPLASAALQPLDARLSSAPGPGRAAGSRSRRAQAIWAIPAPIVPGADDADGPLDPLQRPSELRLALLEEGLHALDPVLGRHRQLVEAALVLEAGGERGLLGGEHGLLGEPRGDRRAARRPRAASSIASSSQRIVGDDLVDQAHRLRLGGVEAPAGQHQLHRPLLAEHPRQALGAAAAGDDPEVDLRLAELGRLGGDDHVAGQRQLAAAAERVAGDGGDQRRLDRGEAPPERRGRVVEGLGEAALAHRLDVGAGGEDLVGAGDHDAAHLGVGVEPLQLGGEPLHHLRRERVARLGPVEAQQGDVAVERALDQLGQAGYSASIGVIALIPVAARPMISFWICEVPS